MLYMYIFLLLLVPVGVTVYYFRSLLRSGIPANAKLLVDAWNSIADEQQKTTYLKPTGE